MPRSAGKELLALRLKYQAAHLAYQSCIKALELATSNGERPVHDLLNREAKALDELAAASRAFREALG